MSEASGTNLGEALAQFGRSMVAGALGQRTGLEIYEESLLGLEGALLGLGRTGPQKKLVLASAGLGTEVLAAFEGTQMPIEVYGVTVQVKIAPLSHGNAEALRRLVPWTAPSLQGVRKAVGLGDRLGLATPGHVRAVRGTGVVPFFAQQSIREMTRTERTPEEVMDAATWGVLQAGYDEGFGSDADHLKTPADADRCAEVGFTMYTVDPGDYVDEEAAGLVGSALAERFGSLPWADLEDSPAEARSRYVDREWTLPDGARLTFSEEAFTRAAVKYGRAVAHTAAMYRHLCQRLGEGNFELEMSVDETSQATSPEEHFYVASELQRLGVKWVGLAPRFVGDFEKGVDYKGDLEAFRESFARHVAVARHFGGYKLSIHSGSDKFSIYPIVAELAGDLVHLKTAGTSYLEALRALARIDPELFREILAFAFERYDEDKATYHVSADPDRVPRPEQLADDPARVLDLFDGRQLLHVTFGSVLTARDEAGGYRFRDRLLRRLSDQEEVYYEMLAEHLGKHVTPFADCDADCD